MIPRGTYRARAGGPETVTWGDSSNHNDQMCVPFRIRDQDSEQNGQRINWLKTVTDGNIDFVSKALEAAGWDGVDFGALTGLGSVDCDIVIVHREFEGKWRAEIEYINPIGRGVFKVPLSDARRVALAERVNRIRGKGPPRQAEPPPDGGGYGGRRTGGKSEWDGQGPDPDGDDDPGF